jgi:C1A family cysteine protease
MVRNYGWCPDVPDFRDFRLSATTDEASLPSSVDFSQLMPSVWDQGSLGSCTGHAIAAAVQLEQRQWHPKWDFTPSRLFIYYNERSVEGTISEDAGAMIRTGIKTVVNQGVCREDLWPYNIDVFAKKPTVAAYKNALLHKAILYQRVPQTQAAIKHVLAGKTCVVFGFSVYESFESQEVARSGIAQMPKTREKLLGGHAVCAVGYDADYVLVRNSWGEDWGIGGYFKLPWSYILENNLADDFWAISKMK